MTSTVAAIPAGIPSGLVAEGVQPVLGTGVNAELEVMLARLGEITGELESDADRVDHLGLLERVKAAAAAAQARVTVLFEATQLAAQDARGVRADKRGKGIGDQIALARRCPASQGSRHLGFSKAVVNEMPHTHDLLTGGLIPEWTATRLVQETAVLSREDRGRVDAVLCAMTVHPVTGEVIQPRILAMTPRRAGNTARALAIELDPAAAVRRAARAAKDRRVTVRPAPDTMSYVTGLLPVVQGVAVKASLTKAARAIKAAGDERTLSQILADLFVERLTGQATGPAVPVEIEVVVDADTLAGRNDRAGRTADGTPVPAQMIRDLAERADAPTWIRRIVTDPVSGEVIDVDRRRRRFHTSGDARFTRARDQVCRHPGCDAEIRHVDHPEPVARGGATSRANSQGLCEHHNYVKEMPGWVTRVVDDRPGRHTIEVTTPTGHIYRSNAPPGLPPPV